MGGLLYKDNYMNERLLHEAELWVALKIQSESFQLHEDWFNWDYEGVSYDINIFTDFLTKKPGATIYPMKWGERGKLETDTLKGVRIL